MLPFFTAIGLVVFFVVVLLICVRNPWRETPAQPDAKRNAQEPLKIDLKSKSALGRWRY